MPPWLIELLKKNNSLGLADTLNTLVPNTQFSRATSPYNDKFRAGITNGNNIGLTKFFDYYFKDIGMGRQGYKSVDPDQKFGDYVLGHEFGHRLTHDTELGTEISQALGDDVPSTEKGYEEFADHFQNAIQFLRSNNLDSKKLTPQSRKIVNVLLKQKLYDKHPINQLSRSMVIISRLLTNAR